MMPVKRNIALNRGSVMAVRVLMDNKISAYEIKKILGLTSNIPRDIDGINVVKSQEKKIVEKLGIKNKVISGRNFKERLSICSNSFDCMLLYQGCQHNGLWREIVLRVWEKFSADQVAKANTLIKSLKAFAESPSNKRQIALINCIELVQQRDEFRGVSSLVLENSPVLSLPRRLLVLKAAQYFS